MPKSKWKWKRTSGRVGPAWDRDEAKFIASHPAPKGFQFYSLTWQGTKYTFLWRSI